MHTPGPWALQEGPSDEALHIYSKNKGFKITSNPRMVHAASLGISQSKNKRRGFAELQGRMA